MKTIVFSHPAQRDLAKLPSDARSLVRHALHRYAIEGLGDVKRLRGADAFRMRIGDYRVIFAEDRMTILAIYIGKRETTTYSRGRV